MLHLDSETCVSGDLASYHTDPVDKIGDSMQIIISYLSATSSQQLPSDEKYDLTILYRMYFVALL